MQVILENYLVIVLVGLFIVFALIGYLIDFLRKGDESTSSDIPKDIKEIQIAKIDAQKSMESPTPTNDVLTNYDNNIVNNSVNSNVNNGMNNGTINQSVNGNNNVNTPH